MIERILALGAATYKSGIRKADDPRYALVIRVRDVSHCRAYDPAVITLTCNGDDIRWEGGATIDEALAKLLATVEKDARERLAEFAEVMR